MYVAANPDAFVDSYFAVNYVHVYTTTPGSPSPSSSVLQSILPVASTSSATSGGAEGQTTTASSVSLWPPGVVSLSASTTISLPTSTTSSFTTPPSASNIPVTCPASNDTTIISNGLRFLIECGIDHTGGDIKALSVNGLQQCIDACATTSGCVDLSLLGDACYLKSSLGTAVENGVWGAKVVEVASPTSPPFPTTVPSPTSSTDTPQPESTITTQIVAVTHTVTVPSAEWLLDPSSDLKGSSAFTA